MNTINFTKTLARAPEVTLNFQCASESDPTTVFKTLIKFCVYVPKANVFANMKGMRALVRYDIIILMSFD